MAESWNTTAQYCYSLGLTQCGRHNNKSPKEVHVLIPKPVTMLPYLAKGTLWCD